MPDYKMIGHDPWFSNGKRHHRPCETAEKVQPNTRYSTEYSVLSTIRCNSTRLFQRSHWVGGGVYSLSWLLAVPLLLIFPAGSPGAEVLGARSRNSGSELPAPSSPLPASRSTLHLAGGDYLAGELRDCDQQGTLRWQGSAFVAPLDFPLSAVSGVSFPAGHRSGHHVPMVVVGPRPTAPTAWSSMEGTLSSALSSGCRARRSSSTRPAWASSTSSALPSSVYGTVAGKPTRSTWDPTACPLVPMIPKTRGTSGWNGRRLPMAHGSRMPAGCLRPETRQHSSANLASPSKRASISSYLGRRSPISP